MNYPTAYQVKFWRIESLVTCQVAPPKELFVMGLHNECNFEGIVQQHIELGNLPRDLKKG